MTLSIIASVSENSVEGKTKIIRPFFQYPHHVLVISKNDVTAGNGERHEVLIGKAKCANTTTCNVFELLRQYQIPLAYISYFGPDSFKAHRCQMIPVEVVVRFEAQGSVLKRNALLQKGDEFVTPMVEFYLKTTNQTYHNVELPCDDPLLEFDYVEKRWALFNPVSGLPILTLGTAENDEVVAQLSVYGNEMISIALRVGEILRDAWVKLDCRLQDFKVEFGLSTDLQLLVADVIDADSWRMEKAGRQLSKQIFRDGASLDEVESMYREVAQLSNLLP